MPSGVTKKDVWKTAETLLQEDRIPTIVSVRSQLGGGNPHTIASYLASWREMHMKEKTLFYTEREALMAAQDEMEQERVDLMEEIERLDSELETANKKLSTSTHALDVERKTSERAKTQSESQQQQLKATQGNAEKLAEQNQTLRIEVAALKERAAHAETLKTLIEKLQSELVDLARGKGADQKGGNEKDIERSAPKQQQNPKQPEIAPRETPKATQKTEEEKPVAQKKTEPQTPLRGLSAPSAPRETAKPEIVKPGIVKPEIVKK